jgi:hypothetical protein
VGLLYVVVFISFTEVMATSRPTEESLLALFQERGITRQATQLQTGVVKFEAFN